MSLPITLALFTSTKGHFDKDTYEYTINRLSLDVFSIKVVHIKWQDGDFDKLGKMATFFEAKGFVVLNTKGDWKHNDQSHYVEHSRDIATLMRHPLVQANPYVFWMEDDVVFKTDGLWEFKDYLTVAIEQLKCFPEKMCVRVLDLENIIPSLQKVEDGHLIFSHKDCFSFRANLMRSRDAWVLGSAFKRDFPRLSNVHIERYATEILRTMSGDDVPFLCFKLDVLKHIHIGSKEFDPNQEY